MEDGNKSTNSTKPEVAPQINSKYPTELVDLPSEGWFYPKDHPLASGLGTNGSPTNILTRRLRYEALEYLCKKSEYGSLHVERLTTIPTVTSEDLAREL